MKTKIQILGSLLLMVGMVLSSSGAVFSMDENMDMGASTGAEVPAVVAATATTASGTVTSVEAEEQYLVIEQKGEGEAMGTSIFHFSSALKVLKDGAEASIADIKAGTEVTVQYTTDENDNKVIDVLTIGKVG